MTQMTPTIPRVGQFVWTFDKYGIGQATKVAEGRCTIRFFKSVGSTFDLDYDTKRVRRAYLPPQTRVYLPDEFGVWSVGRILQYWFEDGEISYDVRFPNQKELRVPEYILSVRCSLPVDDPTGILAAGGMESQFLHDRRRDVLGCLASSRATAHGLTGLLSASVLLMPHQVHVVRRILNDPVQRYMLADEVGLGKTIEACAVIKQAIADNPCESVLVLAPSSLTGQWIRELAWRFHIESPKHQLRVASFDDLDSVDTSKVDTLVVDEVHHLVSEASQDLRRYLQIERLASKAERVLLISATPALANDRVLLALLHILDPHAYRLEDLASFQERVRKRQNLGRLLLALDPNQPSYFLQRTLQSLQALFSSDVVLRQLVAEVEQAIATSSEESKLVTIRALRRHVGDTYRLHHRLIRTRRRDIPADVFPPRSAVLGRFLEEDDDDRSPLLVDALDQWRQRSLEVLQHSSDGKDETFEQNMADRYSRLHDALAMSVEDCAKEIEKQLNDVGAGLEPSFRGDKEALQFALSQTKAATDETRTSFAARVIRSAFRQIGNVVRRPRIVVFGSSTDLVMKLALKLKEEHVADVYQIIESSTDEDVIEAVDELWKSSRSAILVCDRKGEEGLNLQLAHGIVHLDLPLAPARIEQRIGRLDRLGRELIEPREIYHWIISPYSEDFHPWQAWYELLRDGFRVFDRSISEFQFLLDDLQNEIKLALYHQGSVGIRGMERQVSESLDKERQRLDEQYALDRRFVDSVGSPDVLGEIQDRDSPLHYRPIDKWLTQVLRFRRERLSAESSDDAFRLIWTPHTLLAKLPWGNVLCPEYLEQPMTYDRKKVAYRRGVRLVRPGLELVDSLEQVLRWDDRGTAFATWRMDPRWRGEGRGTWLGFRLVFALEANVEAFRGNLVDAKGNLNLRRRMDSLLPPWTVALDVDAQMKPVTDTLLRDILARPYSKLHDGNGSRDFNLGSRREVLYSTIGFSQLSRACESARATAEASLRGEARFLRWMEEDTIRAVGELEADNERLDRRRVALHAENGAASAAIEREIKLNGAIADALRVPSVRLDSIGLFVISNTPPSAIDDSED